MANREDIEKIIKAGTLAPSGSNSQPWKFLVKDGKVVIFALYEKDHPILNYRNRGTLIAHGALLENMEIAAMELGYTVTIELFPQGGDNPVSTITFAEAQRGEHSLYDALFKRSINRKPYKKTSLETDMREALMRVKSGVDVKLIEDYSTIKAIVKAASISERIMFEDKRLHKLLMEEIVWTEKEERQKKAGLFLKTMELNPVQRVLLRILKSWRMTTWMNAIGFSKMLAKGNAKVFESVSTLAVISVPDRDIDFIEAGKTMERLWLTATSLGLRFHVLTGVGFFWQRIFLGNDMGFSDKHKKLIEDAYKRIKEASKSPNDMIPVIICRIGYGNEPTARSSKKDPDMIFE